jgi:hypothetical protein
VILLDGTKANGSGQPFIAKGAGFTVRRISGVLASHAAAGGDPACGAAAASCFVIVLRYDAEIVSQRWP